VIVDQCQIWSITHSREVEAILKTHLISSRKLKVKVHCTSVPNFNYKTKTYIALNKSVVKLIHPYGIRTTATWTTAKQTTATGQLS